MMSAQNNNAAQKRKHKTLSIKEKVNILELLEAGTSAKRLCNIYNIGSSTVYDIRRKKYALMEFYSERELKKGAVPRKTMKEGRCNIIEKALVKWFEDNKNEGVTITGGMLVDQAKIFQKKLNPSFECKYSQGWLEKFKNRHGIKLYDERRSVDSESSFSISDSIDLKDNGLLIESNSDIINNFIKKFSDTVKKERLNPEQIYSASQTTLYWRELPNDILEGRVNVYENSENQIAVFSCFNRTGSHRCKLLVVSEDLKPKALNAVKVLPVIYNSNEKSSITRDIMIDWLENHFAVEARIHCTNLGFPENCKLLLILDSSLAPSNEDILTVDNVIILFMPSCWSFCIQPQEQGIARWLKCWYRVECMADFLEGIIRGKSAENFKAEFDLKASIWALARAWGRIPEISFKRSWHKIYPELSNDDLSEMDVTEVYASYKQQILNPIVDYVKSVNINLTKYICYENLEEWIESGDIARFEEFQNGEMSSRPRIKVENDSDTDEQKEEVVSIEDCLCLTSELISGLEKQDCIAEQDIMNLYRLKANLVAEKFKNKKCLTKENSKKDSPKKTEKISKSRNSKI